MNILQLLSEREIDESATFYVNKVWPEAISEVEQILKSYSSYRKKVVNEAFEVKIGGRPYKKEISYDSLNKFFRSIIVISILNYLINKRKYRLELWWDEVDLLASKPAKDRIKFIYNNYPIDKLPIDKKRIVKKILEELKITEGQAEAFFSGIFGERLITQKSKEKMAEIRVGATGIQEVLGTSIEELVRKLFPKKVGLKLHPNGSNEFPDYEVEVTPDYGPFSDVGIVDGDWIEVKSADLPSKTRAKNKIIKNFNIENGIISSENLIKKGKKEVFSYFGMSTLQSGKTIYYFTRAGKTPNYNIYRMPRDFQNRAKITGSYSLDKNSGDLKIEYKGISLPFKRIGKAYGFSSGGVTTAISNILKEKIFELVKTISARNMTAIISEIRRRDKLKIVKEDILNYV